MRDLPHQRKMYIMGGVLLAMLLGALDGTIVGPAMPTITGELGGLKLLAWVFTMYSLTSTIAVPIVGVDQGIWRARDGLWAGDDGRALGLGGDGRPALDGAAVPDPLLFDALAAAFAELEPEAP